MLGTLTFLKNSSKLVEIFTDQRPFQSMEDERFEILKAVLGWFDKWRAEVRGLSLPPDTRKRMFMSEKCYFDISSMILGFRRLCQISFSKYPGCKVKASNTNSDIVENVFCQQRGANGQSTNPTVLQYG